MKLDVLSDNQIIGQLTHDASTNLFGFEYSPMWLVLPAAYALSPLIPLRPRADTTAELHSAAVRQFFENLLPEGRALEDAALANNISKANLVGLMVALGGETAGSFQIILSATQHQKPAVKRLLTPKELSERIAGRPDEPFSVWDGKVRLSIAGYQDKVAVFKENNQWFLVEGPDLASTVILKPAPVKAGLTNLPSNEFFCMRLAKHVGLPVAGARLLHIPDPVLEIDRFDRKVEPTGRVRRIPIIDACQALGLSVGFKYERPYGNNKDVRNIREGASFSRVFQFLENSHKPAVEKLKMLRWALFQIFIGNTDAHAKNISFYSSNAGFTATPSYDLVSILAYDDLNFEQGFAMAIGDAFLESELTAFQWAHFAIKCGLSPKQVAFEMKKFIEKLQKVVPVAVNEVLAEGAEADIVNKIVMVIQRMSDRHSALVAKIPEVDPTLF